jgi:hypothetical protein
VLQEQIVDAHIDKGWPQLSISKDKKSHEHKKKMNQNGTDKLHWSTTLSEFKIPLFPKEIQ